MTHTRHSRRNFLATTTLGVAGSSIAFWPGKSTLGAERDRSSPDKEPLPDEGSLSPRPDMDPVAKPASSAPRLFGLMADAARVPEDVSYYRRLINFCRQWNLNALLLSLTDDQGCALRFRSHPELITHKHALTPSEAKHLADYGQRQGVQLIPIVESFGHTRYITAVPKYAFLADRDPKSKNRFGGIVPVAPETLRLMTDLYREVAEIFPSKYFHGGCDEVSWGGAKLSREALRTHTRAKIWGQYLNALDKIARGFGKEFIVWGDYVLHKEPDILPLLNKNIIIMDWQYWVSDPTPLEQIARRSIDAGHRTIGAPAAIWCRWTPRPGTPVLQNIDAYSEAYRRIDDPKALGVIVTNWYPSRYLQRSLWDCFAYAAVSLTEGASTARASAFQRFVRKFYGAKWDENWSDVFETFYANATNRKSCSPSWVRPFLPIPWRTEQELKAALANQETMIPPFARLLSQLVFSEALVRRNFDDFLSFRLSAEYLEHVFWRNSVVAEEARNPARTKESAAWLIQTIAQRDQRLLEKLSNNWNSGRPPDAQSRVGSAFGFAPEDQLVFTFQQAASYSAQMARNPDRFIQLLSS